MELATIRVGNTVDFDVRDTYFPTPAEVLMQKFGDRILQGEVTDFTCGGGTTFVVLRVRGVRDLVIVPRSRVRMPLLRQHREP